MEASGLVKTFGGRRAVDGIDLAVPAGSVYGFLGPNGAGKTTTIRMLATLLRPDGGHARVLGHDIVADADAVRGLVALTGQYASVDEDLTGRENLVLLARLLGHRRPAARRRAGELLDAFGLTGAAGRPASTYSGGMRRRLDIAASIVVTPRLLFLDEPTTGLDPRSRNQLWELIRALAAGHPGADPYGPFPPHPTIGPSLARTAPVRARPSAVPGIPPAPGIRPGCGRPRPSLPGTPIAGDMLSSARAEPRSLALKRVRTEVCPADLPRRAKTASGTTARRTPARRPRIPGR